MAAAGIPANPPVPNLREVEFTELQVGDDIYVHTAWGGWTQQGTVQQLRPSQIHATDTYVYVMTPGAQHPSVYGKGPNSDPGNTIRFFKPNPLPGMLQEKLGRQRYMNAMSRSGLVGHWPVNNTIHGQLGLSAWGPRAFNVARKNRRNSSRRSRKSKSRSRRNRK